MRSRPLRSSTLYQPLPQLQCNKPHHKSHSNHILMHTLHTAVHKHIRTHAYMSPLPHAPTCTSCNLIQNARDETPVCTCLHVYTYIHVHKLRQDPVLRSLRTCINLLTHWDRLCYQFAESDVNYTLIPSSRAAQAVCVINEICANDLWHTHTVCRLQSATCSQSGTCFIQDTDVI